ncbi:MULTISPECIES: hypothetical protein [Actinomadura]|uniref:BP74 N-terminal domain-containing protein n=1 Tax=Actinomadura litoris TaxID=2678616 RepID=A0A7K1L3T7_9ACTN|nr:MULTISPECIES: hypothetical protein [Actinomadura]MBT2210083.1 hypothetical protein [Actinomadura sp. NEAU-AAG7]MUN39094.1 hypothetical protein [Actinomadura litoris]
MTPKTFFAGGAVALGLLLGSATSAIADTGAAPEDTQYVATFNVSGESYKVRLVDQDDIDQAEALLNGGSGPSIPNGKINWGVVDVNSPYQWSIDPNNFGFADATTEVCDGRPSYVDGPNWGAGYFCPWDAVITSLDPISH